MFIALQDSIRNYDTLETENDTDTDCSASETENYNYIHPGVAGHLLSALHVSRACPRKTTQHLLHSPLNKLKQIRIRINGFNLKFDL